MVKTPKKPVCSRRDTGYWKEYDVLTFLADTGMYDASLFKSLDSGEKERVLQFTTDYFKKRFVVSRSLIKAVLRHLPGTGNRDAIIISREKKGIVIPEDRTSFSPSPTRADCIALTVAKQKTAPIWK